jgi:ribonuclease P protein component
VVSVTRSTTPPAEGEPPRVAFVIGRKVGSAVQRNQIRRRLRSILQTASAAGRLPGGAYLVRVQPGAHTATYTELEADMATSLSNLMAMGGGGR